jgi:ATP-dependent helicase/nuclease subunit B
LLEEAVAPDDLRLAAADASASPARAAKLADLADVYAAYLAFLGDDRLDAGQYLQLARDAWPRTDYLCNARVWVDGFAGFTRQEMRLLVDLAQRAEHMEISLLADPAAVAEAKATGEIDPAHLFARPVRTLQSVGRAFAEAGIDILPPMVLAPELPPRFALAPELAELERGLAEGGSRTRSEGASHNLDLIEAPDRRTEVEFAVAQVCRWVQESGGELRYRDVAIIVRDFAPYGDLLSAALSARHVPFFLDQRRGLAHHPLVEFVRAALALAGNPYALEPIRLLLKTGLLDLPDDAADELENYLLAHGIAGETAWTGADWAFQNQRRGRPEPSDAQVAHLARVNAARQRVRSALNDFITAPATAPAGKAWSDRLKALLAKIDAAGRLERWAVECEARGDAEQASAHRQTLDAIVELLDDLEKNLGETPLDAAEAAGVLEAGLAQLTLGLIPPTLDEILVGSIERSRHPDIRAAVVLGFNDGVIPQHASEDSILNDDDRALLERRVGPVGVTRDQRLLDEALLAYIAATRASRRLVIMYSAADESGKALLPSPYIDLLRSALPGLTPRKLGNPQAQRATWPIQTAGDLATSLTAEFRRRPALERDDVAIRRRWNDLYAQARRAPTLEGVLRPAVTALAYQNTAELSADTVRKIWNSPFRASVSELETFSACAFQHFARYGLRLTERTERALEPTDVGTVHHAILEDFLNNCLSDEVGFAQAPAEDILARLQASQERVQAAFAAGGELASARDTYLLSRSARDLAAIMNRQQGVAQGGRFRPKCAEKSFGYPDEGSLAAVELTTPKGRRVQLRGFIDRIDLAEVGEDLLGVVVDYKRTRDKRLDLGQVYHGLSLQLVGYLLALAEHGHTLAGRKVAPAGAFYVSLLPKYRSVKHPSEADGGDGEGGEEGARGTQNRSMLPRGLLNAKHLDALEENVPASGWARNFQVFRKADNSLGRLDSTDAAEPKDFDAVLAHVRQRMGELVDGILDGDIRVSPYRLKDFSPCGWCRMQTLCRFEFADGGVRRLDALTRLEVFERTRKPDAG